MPAGRLHATGDQRTPQLSSTINFVAAGMGVAIVPACMRHQRPESVRFVSVQGLHLKAEPASRHDGTPGGASSPTCSPSSSKGFDGALS